MNVINLGWSIYHDLSPWHTLHYVWKADFRKQIILKSRGTEVNINIQLQFLTGKSSAFRVY